MNPKYKRNNTIGKKKTIPCLNCDGSKKNPENPTEDCSACNGKGKIEGVIVPNA